MFVIFYKIVFRPLFASFVWEVFLPLYLHSFENYLMIESRPGKLNITNCNYCVSVQRIKIWLNRTWEMVVRLRLCDQKYLSSLTNLYFKLEVLLSIHFLGMVMVAVTRLPAPSSRNSPHKTGTWMIFWYNESSEVSILLLH